ncbi:hypothetical protein FPV67DRAFT_1450101 [Lyophyllum atratum]|nr:hypothetical protein FPV67DRAFT_1450101 [Lyophyllum atratum]
MTPQFLLRLLRVLHGVSIKHLLRHCRNFWAFIWHSYHRHAFFAWTRRSSQVQPPQAPKLIFKNIDVDQFGRVERWRDVSTPGPCAGAQAMTIPTIAYATRPDSLDTSSMDIALQVIPPDDSAVSEDGLDHHPYESRSSRGDSMTLASDTDNNISHQIFLLQPSLITGSRVSLVLPTAPSLRPEGDVAHIGTSGATGFSNGISDVIYPIMPTKIPRYKRDRKIDTKTAAFELDAAQDAFSLGDIPRGWEQVTHPEGQPYFYHREKRIVTENWIWDPREMAVLDDFIEQIEDFARSRNLYQPPDTHIVLECTEEDDQWWCGYYYACASTRSLFWLEKYEITKFLDEIRGDIHPTHIKLYLEYEYCGSRTHWDLFPNVNKATDEIFDLIANTIADARTDVQTSKQTTVNHSTDDLKEMADIVEWRFMAMFLRDQFLNFHGQYGARLYRSQSIYSHKRHSRTWFIKALSPILFAAPNVHLSAVEDLWASILLNANVAFLAIPSNDPSNNTSTVLPARSAAQIASYLSVVTSFASMMIGLLLVRQHKTKERASIVEFHQYLRNREHPVRGFEELASIYSLPYALLTWAMGSFLVAFMLMCFQISTTLTRSIVGLVIGLVCALIIWCVWMAWEETEFRLRHWFKTTIRQNDTDSEHHAVLGWSRRLRSWPENMLARARRGGKKVDSRGELGRGVRVIQAQSAFVPLNPEDPLWGHMTEASVPHLRFEVTSFATWVELLAPDLIKISVMVICLEMQLQDSLTTGQITFILRAVVQVLSYGGLFILGLIIIGSAPLTAPVETHDVLNRIVGQSTATTTAIKWIFPRVRRKKKDPVPSLRLLLALLLFLFYAIFVSVSDIGFIGFHACDVAGANSLAFPASVQSDDDARNLVAANLLSGTDPASVHAYRCDAAEPHFFGVNATLLECTSWRNSTYADPYEFRDINTTDSDALMPLQLARYNYARSSFLDLNMYYRGFGPQRLSRPVIARGLAIAPHATGLRVVVGVPHLLPHQKVVIPKALALEIDVGCMSLGIGGTQDAQNLEDPTSNKDTYAMGDSWRDYTGPDYLSGVLSETVDIVREGLLPLFDPSTKNANGDLRSYNASFGTSNWQATIDPVGIPLMHEGLFNSTPGTDATDDVNNNCTKKLHTQLGLPLTKNYTFPAACTLLQIGGSIVQNGTVYAVKSRMACASTTQVNMVSATIALDAAGNATLDLTRLPSTLNVIEADYWDALPDPLIPGSIHLEPHDVLRRYILSPNATGPRSHFLFQEFDFGGGLTLLQKGPGSGVGSVFSRVGAAIWGLGTASLGEEQYYAANLSSSKVTAWAGEMAGSYVQATLGYNGWAARNGEAVVVTSTGGRRAACFDARYGAAFMPLFVAALVVLLWGVIVVLTRRTAGIQYLKIAYGGLTPYTRGVGADELEEETILTWESDPHMHLEVVPKDTSEDQDAAGKA